MTQKIAPTLKELFTFRWQPGKDLAAVIVSWLLVVGGLYTASIIVGPTAGGGLPYFFLYAVVTATLFGVGIPLVWMVGIRRRPLSDLGITTRRLGLSLIIQVILAILLFLSRFGELNPPELEELIPLIALALTIGFFEALFWRGWVQLRIEEAFGILPGIVLGSALYAVYHIGYGMPSSEIAFLFLIGLMFAVVFRITKNIFILWPLFQPIGQLITLINDGLSLPILAALGFFEVLVLMLVLVWLANRYYRKHVSTIPERSEPVPVSAD
jgi:membrane protease YdiL (CAAX protease family)